MARPGLAWLLLSQLPVAEAQAPLVSRTATPDRDLAARVAVTGHIDEGATDSWKEQPQCLEPPCFQRLFRSGFRRSVPAVAATASEVLHYVGQVAPSLLPRADALATVYVLHLLASLQADLGVQGDLVLAGAPPDNTTQHVWNSLTLGRRRGEAMRSFEEAGIMPTSARFLLFAGHAAAPADLLARRLAAAGDLLAEGGVLAVEGLQDLEDRPQVQEAFHAVMQAGEQRQLAPFMALGVVLLLAHPRYAGAYRGVFSAALPRGSLVNDLCPKLLYGGEVLVLGNVEIPEETLRVIAVREDQPLSWALWAEAFTTE